MKIFIAIPSQDTWTTEFCISLLHIQRFNTEYLPQHQFEMINAQGTYITGNRNMLTKMALELGGDAMIQFDTDMWLPPWTCRELLAHNVDIVGCNYRARKPPHNNLGIVLHENDKIVDPAKKHLVEMGRLPGGCMYFNMRIFDKIKRPWFRMTYDEAAEFENHEGGEDYYICDKAREAGFKVWGDMRLSQQIAHNGITYDKDEKGDWIKLKWRP